MRSCLRGGDWELPGAPPGPKATPRGGARCRLGEGVREPQGPVLGPPGAWKAYIEEAFSLEGLSARLLPLLNSVRLAGRGISAPKVPVPTLGARDFLAAWYLANLLSVKERLAWRDQEIRRLEEEASRLPEGSEKSRKLRELEKRRQDQEKELKKYGGELRKKWEEIVREEEKRAEKRRKLEERLQGPNPKDRPLEERARAIRPPSRSGP